MHLSIKNFFFQIKVFIRKDTIIFKDFIGIFTIVSCRLSVFDLPFMSYSLRLKYKKFKTEMNFHCQASSAAQTDRFCLLPSKAFSYFAPQLKLSDMWLAYKGDHFRIRVEEIAFWISFFVSFFSFFQKAFCQGSRFSVSHVRRSNGGLFLASGDTLAIEEDNPLQILRELRNCFDPF